jgi:hypothetical protein
MTNAATLRERAAQVRDHAREYDKWAGRPLLERARTLELEAALLERAGRERRAVRTSGPRPAAPPPRPVFGRAGKKN